MLRKKERKNISYQKSKVIYREIIKCNLQRERKKLIIKVRMDEKK